MKKRIVMVSRSVVCVLLVGCTVCSVWVLRKSQTDGRYSDVCGRISPEAREWINERFGSCPTFEELLRQLDVFAIENFKYESIPLFMGYLQTFDLDRFLFGKNQFEGLCFDFSCWVKDCVLVWADKNDISVKAYVLDVKGNNYAHSYNVFFYEGGTYTLDVTLEQSRAKIGEKAEGPLYWFDASIEQIAKHYNETIVIWR